MKAWAVVAVVAAIAAPGIATSCSDSSDGDRPTASEQADRGWKQPGTRIVGPLLVAEQSRLAGVAFPSRRIAADPPPLVPPTAPAGASDAAPTTTTIPDGEGVRYWRAMVVVEGDPAQVFDAYAQQYAKAGIALTAASVRGEGPRVCWDVSGTDTDPARVSRRPPVSCRVADESNDAELEMDVRGTAQGPIATIELSIRLPDGEVLPSAEPADPAPPAGINGPLPEVDLPSDLAGPGGVIAPDGALQFQDLPAPAGTRSLTPGVGDQDNLWVAVLLLDGNLGAITGELLGSSGNEGVFERRETVAGRLVIERGYDVAGGDKLSLTAVEDNDGTWFGFVDAATDP